MTVRYCGRDFTDAELELIEQLIRDHPTREAIARAVCERLNWVKPDGQPKVMSAKVALLRMHRDNLIVLPAPRTQGNNVRKPIVFTPASDPQDLLTGTRRDIRDLRLRRIRDNADSRLWNELIGRYHYLGYVPLTGAQIRYFIEGNDQILGALGISASAWKVAPRDLFIGWSHEQREARLHLIVNNSRFLILPWVQVKYLASSVLSILSHQLASDWENTYSYRPVLLETFVERDRFRGTCYKAANWIHVGCTQGRGKLDRHTLRQKPVKEIFLFPLAKNFRIILSNGITE
ncbi:MAG: DUF4338 domain-containing protein [Dehalococcoidia bacterium]